MKVVLALLVLFVAFAVGSELYRVYPVANAKRNAAPQDPCTGNPCGSGETCCILAGNQAGCCPAANACCCPDQAHCCASGKCQCSGSCPGSGCTCTQCTSSGGQCQPSF